ncbi:MAG: hypothetical protein J0H21_01375, partial [Rhizobiales bacterium]|nr:hypothetical protein [Hyphomicrobiales bacterium]
MSLEAGGWRRFPWGSRVGAGRIRDVAGLWMAGGGRTRMRSLSRKRARAFGRGRVERGGSSGISKGFCTEGLDVLP